MADNAQTITVTAPEGYKPEEGKPISFDLPVSSFDITKFAPKEIAEKPYFKDKIKTADDFWKSVDGAQTLIGSRPKYSAPAIDAPQEEWDAFNAVTRAPKVDDYQLAADPNAPAELKMPTEMQAAVKQMFYDAGIAPKQATALQKGYDALMMKLYTVDKEKRAVLDKQFTEMAKPYAGAKPEESFARAKQVLTYLLPKELHAFVNEADNKSLTMMMALTQVIEEKYMKEDELPRGGGVNEGKTKEDLQAKGRQLMIERDKLPSTDPKKIEMQKEIDALYQQIAAL